MIILILMLLVLEALFHIKETTGLSLTLAHSRSLPRVPEHDCPTFFALHEM